MERMVPCGPPALQIALEPIAPLARCALLLPTPPYTGDLLHGRSKQMSTTATMTSSGPERFRRPLLALLLAAAVAAMMLAVVMAVGAKPAQAAFPGANGKI